LIHPHRLFSGSSRAAGNRRNLNVGFAGFRISEETMACTARSRQQMLDLCIKEFEKDCGRHRFPVTMYAMGYLFQTDVVRCIYRKYVEKLRRETF
jgi:hypothetical protein